MSIGPRSARWPLRRFYEAQEYQAEIAADAAEPGLTVDPDDAERDHAAAPGAAPQQVAAPPPAPGKSLEQQIKDDLALMRTDYNKYWSEPHQAKMTALYEHQAAAAEQGEASLATTGNSALGDTIND